MWVENLNSKREKECKEKKVLRFVKRVKITIMLENMREITEGRRSDHKNNNKTNLRIFTKDYLGPTLFSQNGRIAKSEL